VSAHCKNNPATIQVGPNQHLFERIGTRGQHGNMAERGRKYDCNALL
jgi:hypothetical protein